MKFAEKDTSSGRDIREYICVECGFSDWEDRGTALWKVLHDARDEDDSEPAAPPAPQPAIPQPATPAAPASRWRRFLARFRPRPK